jgi:2-C-methyl-D-erythritol 4-phosphate cytidylyltransferase
MTFPICQEGHDKKPLADVSDPLSTRQLVYSSTNFKCMKKYAIIVAGGKGLRMNAELPKQFIPVGGKPVLMWTIEAFYQYNKTIEVILVLPVSHQEYWETLCRQYNFELPYIIADGGESRFHSVRSGLEKIDDEEALVAVHDGVRPFAGKKTIADAFACAQKYDTAVPVIELTDSVRKVDESGNRAVDRDSLKLVQTPQVFKSTVLKNAYCQPYCPEFTDDASVVEKTGLQIMLTEGNKENIKITTPFDLKIAEILVNIK